MRWLFFSCIFISVFSFAQKSRDESTAFLSLGNVGLEKLNDVEEKKKFLETVDIEKQKISDYLIKRILDNAYELYRNGDYEGAATVAKKVLSIDPSSEEAKMIANASRNIKGKSGGKISFDEQFAEALTLYQKGEVLDAYRKVGVLVRLSPSNVKAKYWYKKIEADLKDYYISKAGEYYSSNDKKNALVMYYRALEFAPKDREILSRISGLENEMRQDKLNQKLKDALEIYASGRIEDAYALLKEAISINPADEKTNKLFNELKSEIENKYIKEGDAFYKKKQYLSSIKSFTKALAYSDNPSKLERVINNIKKTMKKEEEAKKRYAEEKKRKEEEKRRKEKEEEEAKKSAQASTTDVKTSTTDLKNIISEQNKIAAQQHWVEGVKYLQSGDYQKAKEELSIAKKLDPTNSDIDAALKRIDQILGGGQ
ncbi:MAG: hypothetical protein K6357_04790 [Elusimicrobiota bacterium]